MHMFKEAFYKIVFLKSTRAKEEKIETEKSVTFQVPPMCKSASA